MTENLRAINISVIISNAELPQPFAASQFRLPVDEAIHGIANDHIFNDEPPAAIFSDKEDWERLKNVRNSIHIDKKYSDVTPEHKKLLFTCWLIEHNKLKS